MQRILPPIFVYRKPDNIVDAHVQTIIRHGLPGAIDSADQVNNFLLRPEVRPYGEVFQTWEWGEYQRSRGVPTRRLGAWLDGDLVATIFGFLEDDRFGPYFYCPRGPAMDWSNRERATQVLRALREYVREAEPTAVCLRCDPSLAAGSPDTAPFRDLGFRPAGNFVSGGANVDG